MGSPHIEGYCIFQDLNDYQGTLERNIGLGVEGLGFGVQGIAADRVLLLYSC